MFSNAVSAIRESVYGIMAWSIVGPNQVNFTNGTGFMVAPGILATAGHLAHVNNDPTKPLHTNYEVIRSPEIASSMEVAEIIAVDDARDLALIRIQKPRIQVAARGLDATVPSGTSCGALGFPLAAVSITQEGQRLFNLTERFQGAHVSAYYRMALPDGRTKPVYETDALMYSGSSGCPGFLANGTVFGMHVASVMTASPSAANPNTQGDVLGNTRLAISLWVPFHEISAFLRANNVSSFCG